MNSFLEEVVAFFMGEVLPLLVIAGMVSIGVIVALVMIILILPVFLSCVIFIAVRRLVRWVASKKLRKGLDTV